MKFSIFLLFVCVFSTFAEGVDSQTVKVNIRSNNLTIGTFIDQIERQTNYLFVYSKNDINTNQSISIKSGINNVSSLLNEAFRNSDIKYYFDSNYVILTKRASSNDKNNVSQNDLKVSGLVVDSNGDPIIGASVVENGTSNGTITNIDGKFSFNCGKTSSLVVSYIGYKTQIIPINGKSYIKVVMKEDSKALDEIVVVGYGSTSNRKLVSSVSTVKTEKVSDLPFNSNSAALQGRVAGVIVQASDGEPGNSPNIYIRGGGTPLYVIDGIIRSSSDFNNLTSSDIENISILKDASATAVYGAQAGNGIVLVTTKKGGSDNPKIEYNAGFDWSKPTVIPERMNTKQYTDTYNRAFLYDGNTSVFYTPEEVAKMCDVDWLELATKSWTPSMRHNLNLSGTTAKGIKYYNSLSYLDQGTIFKESRNNTYKRYNLRSNVSSRFDKIGLEVALNVDATLEKRNPNPAGQWEIWRNLLGNLKSLQNPYNPDGTYSDLDVHPLTWLDKDGGYDHKTNSNINTQLQATWELPWVKGLKFGMIGNYRYSGFDEKLFISHAAQYTPDGKIKDPYMANNRAMGIYHSWAETKDLQANFEYEKSIGKHYFELQGVYTYTSSYQENSGGERRGFVSTSMDQMNFGSSENQTTSGMAYESARIGWVGRLRYSYADKYYIEGNFRYDGSDNFAPNKRWGFFPSAAIAWIPSEEKFMQSLKKNHIIDFLKVRLSYGKVGLEDGVARFGYKSLYGYNEYGQVLDGKYQASIYEGNLVDPNNLTWYSQDVFDFGFDLYTLNNKLNVSMDYFYYKTKNYLISPKSRYSTTLGKGLPQIKSNSEKRRAGFEFSARYKDEWNGLKYDLGVNLTSYNELWAVNEGESLDILMNPRRRSSQELLYWGMAYKNAGIYQNIDDVLNSPHFVASTELRPGDLGYKDINGDGKIDSEDRVRIGKPLKPSLDYGFDFNLNYKGFFLYGLFQGTSSRYQSLGGLMTSDNLALMNFQFQSDIWTPDNAGAKFPRVSTEGSKNSNNNRQMSDFWLFDAKYFRLKSLQFGYDFKSSLLKSCKSISQLKLSLAGTNLFTISDAMDYFDPETDDNGGQSYPVQKTLSLVINVGF